MEKTRTSGRVIVVSRDDAGTVGDCLDVLAEQCPEDVEVVVVDRNSSDASADVAIRHPRPDRVLVVPPDDLQRVLDAAAAETARVLVLRADARPDRGWLPAALCALDRAAVAFGPDRQWGNLAIDVSRLRTLRLFAGTESMDEILRRVHAAGETSVEVAAMRVAPARTSPPVAASLPDRPALPADRPGYSGRVSVVLCTRDRPTHLARCLRSLGRLADDDHEILVVDNHPTPTVDAAALPARARLVHEPRPGLDVARNRGWSEATGAVVAYIDDDCEADPGWITALRAGFVDPSVGLVTGRVRPASLARPTQRYFEMCFTFDRGLVRRRFTPWDDRPWFPLWTGPVGTGCNMAARRDLLADLGGFDELLDVGTTIGGAGDLDVYARIIDRGVLVEYTPDALVWHHHRDNRSDLDAQFRGYGEAIGAYLMKAVLDRPGLRLKAVRYYAQRLADTARLARDVRAGGHVVPMGLVREVLLGQLAGPALYARARRAARRGR